MSNCIIQIKIGDQVITLDPNSDISANNATLLVDSIDVNKLRILYSNLKDKVDFNKALGPLDNTLVQHGQKVYDDVVAEAMSKLGSSKTDDQFKDNFVSPMAALSRVKNEEDRKALSAYINSLDAHEVLTSGNFLENMRDAYKLSPYTRDELRSLVFKQNSSELELFDSLTHMPGMETLRMSIAITPTFNNQPLTEIKGVYMSPDNIIQVLVPSRYYVKPSSLSPNVNKDAANLTPSAYNKVRRTMLHELTHAIYSELYNSSKTFRGTIDSLKDKFNKEVSERNDARLNTLALSYQDPHEFLADMFTSRKLQAALNTMVSKDKLYQSAGYSDLYNILISNLTQKYQDANSLLKDVLASMAQSVPLNTLTTSFEAQARDYLDSDKSQSIFFTGEATDADILAHMNMRDQTDSYQTVNDRAYTYQKNYLARIDNRYMKDAHYGETIVNPTDAQIDRLYGEDLAIVPWTRYEKGVAATDSAPAQPGSWIEIGVLVNDKGKEILGKDRKPITVDVKRDNKGNIIQNDSRGVIEERKRTMPVVYSNSNSKTVTLSKVGLKSATEQTYNTVSLPYEMIKGIKKYDRNFFDHAYDYSKDIEYANTQLVKAKGIKEPESRLETEDYWTDLISKLEAKKEYAESQKQMMRDDYKKYAFAQSVDGVTKFNMSRDDYANSSFAEPTHLNSSLFTHPNEAVYSIATIKSTGNSISVPNPNMFRILWQADLGTEFAKLSKNMSEAVTRGDMVRVPETYEAERDGHKVKLPGSRWLPVFKVLANGVMVSTADGKGYVVAFNKIDAYAKNTTTDSWSSMLSKLVDATQNFKDRVYLPKSGSDENTNVRAEVQYKSLQQFNPDYNQKENESEESAVLRFNKNQDKVRSYIKPLETFVKVARTYQPKGEGKNSIKEFQSIELVVAKTDEGLLTLREYEGRPTIDFIHYSDSLDAKNAWGKELLFMMEDVTVVNKLYQDYIDDKAKFAINSKKESFVNDGTKENPKIVPAFDFKENPRNYRDVYDIYEDVDGVKVSRLVQGDIVGIRMDNSDKPGVPEFYWRKVVRVLDDGTVVVADKRAKDQPWGKAGVFPHYISADDIVRVGYRLGNVDGNKEDGFTSEFHQDLIDRRSKLFKYAMRDLQWNDFMFAKSNQSAIKFNSNIKYKDSWHERYVPLTNKILTPKTTDPEVFLDRNLKPTTEDKAAMVKAKFNGDAFGFVLRGINANTTYWKTDNITQWKGKKLVVHPDILKNIMPGDWIITEYKDKSGKRRQWENLIDRVEGGTIYKLNPDRTTTPMSMMNVVAIRTSVRNDKFSNFTRNDAIMEIVKELKNSKTNNTKMSLDLPFKSPVDSRRAIFEIGERMKSLNPDVQLSYVEKGDIKQILKDTGHDYNSVRAFVMDGKVLVNLEKASVSDVIHEYAHLFLHNLKYENPGKYEALISMAQSHPLYDDIAKNYSHLSDVNDINEEAFVTLLGEHMKGRMEQSSNSWFNNAEDKENIVNFADYTKQTLNKIMNSESKNLYNISNDEVLNMQLEQVMDLVGDEVMKSRISSMYDNEMLQSSFDVERLREDLLKRGLMTQECYG